MFNLIIIIFILQNIFGGQTSMNTKNLLLQLTQIFSTSTTLEAQQLFTQIRKVALTKLKREPIKSQKIKQNQSIRYFRDLIRPNKIRLSKRHLNKTIKRKFISKQKLKLTAIKRICNENKKIHEKYLSNKLQQQSKKNQQKFQQPNSYCQNQHQQQQEEKLQSPHYSYQKILLIPHQKNIKTHQYLTKSNVIKPPSILIQEKFKKIHQNFQKYINSDYPQSKADQLICPICIQILIDPVSTICGHSFCYRCLDQSLLFASTCPICRLQIKGQELLSCEYLQQLICRKSKEFLDDQKALETYNKRRIQNEQWKEKRFINPQKIQYGTQFIKTLGTLIDVRDTQSIWCHGCVKKVYFINEKKSSILVHYQFWAKIYDEIIEIKSTRLSPQGYFTSRADIPRYSLTRQDENLRGAVINGSVQQYRQQTLQVDLPNVILRNVIDAIGIQMREIHDQQNVFIPIVREENEMGHDLRFLNRRINFSERSIDNESQSVSNQSQALSEMNDQASVNSSYPAQWIQLNAYESQESPSSSLSSSPRYQNGQQNNENQSQYSYQNPFF